jgi:CBS domain-containing protein
VFVETELPVREIMTRDVITVDLQTSCVDAARKMLEHGIGGIIVTDREQPVGIITERDLVRKVISRDRRPSSIAVKDVMTTPLITIPSTDSVNNAMRKMFKLRIRRLPVVDENRLVGIVTDTDLLVVSYQMGGIFTELIQMDTERFSAEERSPTHGICEECGRLSEKVMLSEGKYLCEVCADTE